MFIKAIDGDLYNTDEILKIIEDKGQYKITFVTKIKINKDEIYIQKYFDKDSLNIKKLGDEFVLVDENLILNMNKIIKVTLSEDYAFFTTLTKKRIGTKFLNYNIKVSNKNNSIENMINECIKLKRKGEKVNNKWVKWRNNFYNMNNVNNIVYDFDNLRVILNFKTSESNDNKIENIRPSYEVDFFRDEEEMQEWLKEASEGMLKFNNRYVNVNNIYNIKIDKDRLVIFMNFVSNISKTRNGKKIISTEFVKQDFSTLEELERVEKEIISFISK